MQEQLNERLLEAKENKWRFEKAERRRAELLKRKNEQQKLVMQLELQLASEQADVEALTRMSLANLFHTILRSKEEQLEMERQQALAAAMKLQEAQTAVADAEAELMRVGEELGKYINAERDYTNLIIEKEQLLKASPNASSELAEMEEQLSNQLILVRELEEALTAGSRVSASLTAASASLEKAENWGKWDMWANGGLVSTHLKHGHIDDAKQAIQDANRLFVRFRDELADLDRSISIQIDISSMLKMADYWFDGFITDWVVQGRIENAQEQTLQALRQVRTVVQQLQSELMAAEGIREGLRQKRTSWIEGTSPS